MGQAKRRSSHLGASAVVPEPPAGARRAVRPRGAALAAVAILVLAAITGSAFHGVLWSDFVLYDDPYFVMDNPRVTHGLTAAGALWSLTTGFMGTWQPLTWLSLMLDVQLFGVDARAMHAVNLLLHLASAILVLLFLRRITGAPARSFLVAALFAVHPLHVESVAWISERKDVLSHLFIAASLLAWSAWTARRRRVWYGAALLGFACGLAAKPTVVVLPMLMLALDFWPLGRLAVPTGAARPPGAGWPPPRSGVLVEKIPFLLLAAAAAAVTIRAQSGAVAGLDQLALVDRVENAVLSVALYLGKTIWPAGLAAFYPLRTELPLSGVLLAGAALVALTGAAVRLLRRAPYLAAGWAWYLVALIPVIGIVQVGDQAMADRYTYLPLTGIFLAAVWGAADLAARKRFSVAAGAVAALAVLGLVFLSERQARVWRNSTALFEHQLAVAPDAWFGHAGLGVVRLQQGNIDEAIARFREALRLRPGIHSTHLQLGDALLVAGRTADAVANYREALRLAPWAPLVRIKLGTALLETGAFAEAQALFERELAANPEEVAALDGLGTALAGEGRPAEALRHLRRALELAPGSAAQNARLASVLAQSGATAEAATLLQRALALAPRDARLHNNLGLLLARLGRTREAEAHYRGAIALDPRLSQALGNLGALLAAEGRTAEARALFEAARVNPGNPAALTPPPRAPRP